MFFSVCLWKQRSVLFVSFHVRIVRLHFLWLFNVSTMLLLKNITKRASEKLSSSCTCLFLHWYDFTDFRQMTNTGPEIRNRTTDRSRPWIVTWYQLPWLTENPLLWLASFKAFLLANTPNTEVQFCQYRGRTIEMLRNFHVKMYLFTLYFLRYLAIFSPLSFSHLHTTATRNSQSLIF